LVLKTMLPKKKYMNFVEDRITNDLRYFIDTSKMKKLNWHVTTSFEDGLKRTYQWYSQHQHYWNNNITNKALMPHNRLSFFTNTKNDSNNNTSGDTDENNNPSNNNDNNNNVITTSNDGNNNNNNDSSLQ